MARNVGIRRKLFSNEAAYDVDIVHWVGGAVERLLALFSTLVRRIEAEYTLTVGLKFRFGAICNINVSLLAFPKSLECSI